MWRFLKSSRIAGTESDVDLIAEYRKHGSMKCIEVLYNRYAQTVYAACMKYLRDEEESKDAVSRIFEKLVIDLKRFDVKQFNNWLHRIAYNYCMTVLEKKNRVTGIEKLGEVAAEDDAEEPAYGAVSDAQLQQAINQLEEHQRKCIELFYLNHKSYVEVAAETGFTMLQVKSFLQNGKRNLKIILTQR